MTFTCYFCNKLIQNDTEVGHSTVCSRVLIPCSYKCGSYVPRIDMQKHRKECVNAPQTSSMSKAKSIANLNQFDSVSMPNTSSLDRRVDFQMKNQIPNHTEMNGNNSQYVRQYDLVQNVNDLYNMCRQTKQQIENLQLQNKSLIQWKTGTEMQVNKIMDSIGYFQTSKSNSDVALIKLQEKLKVLDQLQHNTNILKDSFVNEQLLNRKITSDVTQNLDNFRISFEQQLSNVMTIINIQKSENEELMRILEKQRDMIEEQKLKLTNVLFDLRATSQIASGTEEKIEIQEREHASLKKEIEQLRMDIENLEGTHDKILVPGKLLWKISDIQSKLKTAQDTNCYYKSSVFYTHENGYKIRLLLYLNGLKKWRDRYALISIDVLKGDYDLMLKWPCHIEGTVTLRDLERLDDPRHFSKPIVAKRENAEDEGDEPQESSATFIFIPHSVLFKEKHVKEDTMYLEIKIDRTK